MDSCPQKDRVEVTFSFFFKKKKRSFSRDDVYSIMLGKIVCCTAQLGRIVLMAQDIILSINCHHYFRKS